MAIRSDFCTYINVSVFTEKERTYSPFLPETRLLQRAGKQEAAVTGSPRWTFSTPAHQQTHLVIGQAKVSTQNPLPPHITQN